MTTPVTRAVAKPGVLIRQARTDRGLTQSQLAELAGTTQSAISRLESNRVSPTIETLARLLDVLGCELEMNSRPKRAPTILEANSAVWAALDAEKRAALRAQTAVPVEQLLQRGVALSVQAARLRRGIVDAPLD